MSLFAGLRHHAAVTRAALQEERERSKAAPDARRPKRHELEFMPAALEITETPA